MDQPKDEVAMERCGRTKWLTATGFGKANLQPQAAIGQHRDTTEDFDEVVVKPT